MLVENKFSLISAGTERSTVTVGQASLVGKAKLRPDLVKQVFQNVRKEGLLATIAKVRTKLDSLKALGYSTAGTVTASLDTRSQFRPGDRVACAGQDYASHAEIVSVPQNLVARIPDNVSFEAASFTTLGAIALQGVRQAGLTLGESVCVIGLGLLGQLTCQLLQAHGCRVFGLDPAPRMVDLANQTGAAQALLSGSDAIPVAAATFTDGQGFDAVIITAATPTNGPIELAAELLRKNATRLPKASRSSLPKASRSSHTSLSDASGKGGEWSWSGRSRWTFRATRISTGKSSNCGCRVPMGRGATTRSMRKRGTIIRSGMCAGRSSGTWKRFCFTDGRPFGRQVVPEDEPRS